MDSDGLTQEPSKGAQAWILSTKCLPFDCSRNRHLGKRSQKAGLDSESPTATLKPHAFCSHGAHYALWQAGRAVSPGAGDLLGKLVRNGL